ncbi:MAG: hypothetical protein ACPF9D_08815 [Owenweeksia sp.]
MKIKLALGALLISAFGYQAMAQFSFGVSPGITTNSAYFGYKLNDRIVPYVNFQYMNARFKYEETGERYDFDANAIVSYTDEIKFSGSLIIPGIGAKYFFTEKNDIKAYGNLSLAKPFLTGKVSLNGEEDEEFSEELKSVNMWAGELGFGVEYFFDDNFSVGGEFGLRYLSLSYDTSYETENFNPNTNTTETSTVTQEYSLGFNPTYSKISLNYYF